MSNTAGEISEEDQLVIILDQMFTGEQIFMKVDDLKEIQGLLRIHPQGGKYIELIQNQLNAYYSALGKFEEYTGTQESEPKTGD